MDQALTVWVRHQPQARADVPGVLAPDALAPRPGPADGDGSARSAAALRTADLAGFAQLPRRPAVSPERRPGARAG